MEIVPFEIAKKLEEKGYPQKMQNMLAFYNESGECFSLCKTTSNIALYYTGNPFQLNQLVAPTISQVLKWLREEKKIYVSVEVEREDWFEYKIVQTIKNTRTTSTRVYETYLEAILAGIAYVIDNNLI